MVSSSRARARTDEQSSSPTAPLEAIEVTTDKLKVETLIDRKVYSVQSDVQATFGSLSDVLSVIPSVDVDADGIVSLRGDAHVLILIDGRPSTQFSGPSAGENLQSIPAADIDRIEVLTNPPAEFKADGAAGVINVILRKKRPQGFAGSLQGSLGSAGRSVAGTNASYGSTALTASLTAGFREDIRHRLTDSALIAPDAATGQRLDSSSSIDETIRRGVPTLGASVQYALGDRQTLSVDLSGKGRGGPRSYTELDAGTLPSGLVIGSTERQSAGHDREIDADERLALAQKLIRPGELLDVSLHHASSHNDEHYNYTNFSFLPAAASFYDNLSFREDNETSEFAADYTLPLAGPKTLKLGYACERDDYGYGAAGNDVEPVTEAEVPDPNLTDVFKVRQQINAVYASYQTRAGDWEWLGGLRAELASTETDDLTDASATNQRYLRLYPSLHADRSLTDESTLSVAASRRVTRPDTSDLNPYVDHEYAPNLVGGNPDLKPQFTNSYELAYEVARAGLTLALTGYFRQYRDSVVTLTEPLAGGLTLTTKANLPNQDSAGLELSANGHIVPKLQLSLSANPFYSQIDTAALGAGGLRSTEGVNAKVKLDYRPTASDSVQVSATRTDKHLTPQGYVDAINIVNVGYRRPLRQDLTGVITVSNAFNGQRFERVAVTPTFTQDYSRFTYGPIVYVGLVYSFGSSHKVKSASFEYDQ
jgi:outer membrane receptor protein involved in Fe transport